jgi:hypothetical protein
MQAAMHDFGAEDQSQYYDPCTICGAPATQYFAGNGNLPLCGCIACEARLVDDINAELDEAASVEAPLILGD